MPYVIINIQHLPIPATAVVSEVMMIGVFTKGTHFQTLRARYRGVLVREETHDMSSLDDPILEAFPRLLLNNQDIRELPSLPRGSLTLLASIFAKEKDPLSLQLCRNRVAFPTVIVFRYPANVDAYDLGT